MSVVTDRYSILIYYFNIFRTLILFPISEKKEILENVMDEMEDYYINENNKFIEIMANTISNYYITNKLLNILKESKNNSTSIIKKTICLGNYSCVDYLDSKYNIFDSGVDFAFSSSMIKIINIFMDYKRLLNKTDIKEINNTIINSDFFNIQLSLNNMFFYVQERIYDCFKEDRINISESNRIQMLFFNIMSIILIILAFSIMIFCIFISIDNYMKPIKNSIYRMNCSFYYIKKYSLTTYRKEDNFSDFLNN